MNIWNDAFQAYLDAKEEDFNEVLDPSSEDSEKTRLPSLVVMMFMNQPEGSMRSIDKKNYDALVRQFGKEMAEMIMRALDKGSSGAQLSDEE